MQNCYPPVIEKSFEIIKRFEEKFGWFSIRVYHLPKVFHCGQMKLDILRTFRSRLSSLAVPTFAIDLPQGGGKVALQPDYCQDGKYPDIHDQKLIAYETCLPESGSGKPDL